MDLTATQTSAMTGISVRSVNAIYLRLRRKIATERERQVPLEGALEADESYFGPQRMRGKVGRGCGGKTIVFGLLKRGDEGLYGDREHLELCQAQTCQLVCF